MGDVGSGFIGFVIVGLAIIGYIKFNISIVLWLMIYSLFLVDSGVTLFRRIMRRENWMKAHKKHAYQRLYQYGWSHQKVICCVIGVNIVVSALMYLTLIKPTWQWELCAAVYLLMLGLYSAIEKLKPMQ